MDTVYLVVYVCICVCVCVLCARKPRVIADSTHESADTHAYVITGARSIAELDVESGSNALTKTAKCRGRLGCPFRAGSSGRLAIDFFSAETSKCQ